LIAVLLAAALAGVGAFAVNALATSSVDFSFLPGDPAPNDQVDFTITTDNSDQTDPHYVWDFGDSSSTVDTTDTTASHTYTSGGHYTVTVTLEDGGNNTLDSKQHTVVVNTAPSAAFTVSSPDHPTPGQSVSFDATGSTDAEDGTNLHYEWDFNGNGYNNDPGETDTATPSHTFSSAGDKSVSLRVTDQDGATDVDTHNVHINAPPSATFTSSPAHPTPGQSVSFDATGSSDTEDGTNLHYEWDFNGNGYNNDPGETDTATPSHTFASAGDKSVSLRVTDQDGATDVDTHNVSINAPPTADFDVPSGKPLTGASVTFHGGVGHSSDSDGTIAHYQWKVDGVDQSNDNPNLTTSFSPAGTYTITLKVTDNDGAVSTVASHSITVNDPPTAAFTSSPAHPIPGQSVSFNAGGSSDPEDGTNLHYEWDFNGNGFNNDPGETDTATPSHSFSSAGTKSVSLRVTDQDGATDTISHDVNVNAPPTAAFTFTPSNPNVNQTINLDGTGSSDTDGTFTYSWDLNNDGTFGDSTASNPSTSFSTTGPHTVKLRVTDNFGATNTVSHDITVNGPVANFDWTPASPMSGQPVTFHNTSTDNAGTIITSAWDLNSDGSCGTGPNETDASPTKTFATPGNYTIKLCVQDDHGVSDDVTRTVTIGNQPPVASFNFAPASPLPGDLVTFNSTSSDPDGPLASTLWDLNGNGVFGEPGESGTTVSRSFPAPGTYPVTLQVTDLNGATDTDFDSVTVLAPPAPPNPPKSREASPINPFPIITIRGKLTRSGVKISSLVVQTPVGTTVTIKCTGKHCPFKSIASIAKVRRVKFKRLQRTLRSGVVLELYVTHPGEIGKYTRFRIRKNKGPVRLDRCLSADSSPPQVRSCPS
jgi:PKD repeat protein